MYFVVGIQLMYHLVGINVPFGGNKCTIWWDVDNFFSPKTLTASVVSGDFPRARALKREKEKKVLLILVVSAYLNEKEKNPLKLNKIVILSATEKTKEALFAGFFRFLFFLERSFGSLFMLFCMFMQKKGKNKRYQKANKVTGCGRVLRVLFLCVGAA